MFVRDDRPRCINCGSFDPASPAGSCLVPGLMDEWHIDLPVPEGMNDLPWFLQDGPFAIAGMEDAR